jgi:hypothetical protein
MVVVAQEKVDRLRVAGGWMKANVALILLGCIALTAESRAESLGIASDGSQCVDALRSLNDRLGQLAQQTREFVNACAQLAPLRKRLEDTLAELKSATSDLKKVKEDLAAEREKEGMLREELKGDQDRVAQLETTINELQTKRNEELAGGRDERDALQAQIAALNEQLEVEKKQSQGNAQVAERTRGLANRLSALTKPSVEKFFDPQALAPCERINPIDADDDGILVVSGRLLDLDARKKGLSELPLFAGHDITNYVNLDRIERRHNCLNAIGEGEWGTEFGKDGVPIPVKFHEIKDADRLPPATDCGALGQKLERDPTYKPGTQFWVFDAEGDGTVYCHKIHSGWSIGSANRTTMSGLVLRKND